MVRGAILSLSIVAVTALVAACRSESDSGDAVSIDDFSFQPDAIEVTAGTTVRWTNEDDFAHTVTARDDSFESGDLAPDATFRQTFENPGRYEYFCSIHNSMTGTVIVEGTQR